MDLSPREVVPTAVGRRRKRPWLAISVLVAVLVGGWFGAEYGARRFANPVVRRFLGVVLAVAGGKMLLV